MGGCRRCSEVGRSVSGLGIECELFVCVGVSRIVLYIYRVSAVSLWACRLLCCVGSVCGRWLVQCLPPIRVVRYLGCIVQVFCPYRIESIH